MRALRRNWMKRQQGSNRIKQAWGLYQYRRIMKSAQTKKQLNWFKMMFKKLGSYSARKPQQKIYNEIHGMKLCNR